MIYVCALIVLAGLGLYLVCLGKGYASFPKFLTDSRLIKYSGVLLFLFVIDVSAEWALSGLHTPQEAYAKFSHATITKIAAFALRQKMDFPIRVNDSITLMDLQANGGNLVYKMYVQSTDPTAFLNITKSVRDETMKTACSRDDYQKLFHYGFGVEMDLYDDRYGADPIIVTPQDCGY